MATAAMGRGRSKPSFPARAYYWLVFGLFCAFTVLRLQADGGNLAKHAVAVLPWIALLAAVHVIPLGEGRVVNLATDFPISTAAALVLTPLGVAVTCFLGAWDLKEFRHGISPSKSFFNRSHTGLGYGLGSLVVHALTPHPARSVFVLLLAATALSINLAINFALMLAALRVDYGFGLRAGLGAMRFGGMVDFWLATLTWFVLGAMLAVLYDQIGSWALLAFLAPTLLSRQVLDRADQLAATSEAYQERGQVLGQISQRIAEERSDERRLIAAELHDEVLQPLFNVTLMAQILKADLQRGRLLDLDEDLPQLLTAAETTASSLRDLIGDLRKSSLGRGGLVEALQSLARETQKLIPGRLEHDIQSTEVDPVLGLVVYQIAKEALGNAVAHSRASEIRLVLRRQESESLVLLVQDNGIGFDQLHTAAGHFGVAIMRERAAAVGAQLFIDSTPGAGCTIRLSVEAG